MQFDHISSNRIRVTLSPQDIAAAGIDPESNDQQEIKRLKKYLFLLLSQIRSQSDLPVIENGTLYIEIYPDPSGGAVIYFTTDQDAPELYEPSVFCFYSVGELIKAAVTLFSFYGHRLFKSSLYQCSDRWLFIIRPFDGALSPAVSLLGEYGEHIPGGSVISAVIEERCKPIIRERAADMLAFYFG